MKFLIGVKWRILISFSAIFVVFIILQAFVLNSLFLKILVTIVALGVFIVGGARLLETIIVDPIRLFIEFANRISKKDLSGQIEIKGQDEFSILARSLNEMLHSLRVILEENLDASEQLAMAASEMSSMAEEANCATEEITTTMEQMAQVSQEQSEKIDLSVLASKQMTETAQQVAAEAQKAANFSSQVAQRAKTGEEILQEINAKILQVKETVDNSAEVVRKLGMRSLEIGKIVDVMRGISRQTNLLALNAAIEAARAGEHGRGFSVVADEVRALAEQSTNSAIQIVEVINEIQAETKAAVEAMELGTKVVDEGTVLTLSAKEAFAEITRSVNETVNTIHEIAAASQEQAASNQEMASTMDSVSTISKQNVKASNQVAQASVEQRMTMENLAVSSAQLVQMADHLTSMVGRFKVKANFQRCWRVLDCNWVDCPAYQAKEEKCWLIPDTLCQDGIPNGKVVDKRSMCHQCEVFKINTKIEY
ncbi:MAG: HAMP domain-containing protein [Firmicutes bacterium]|nr:HAMP domain-containing protein [Bacillota bacterium]